MKPGVKIFFEFSFSYKSNCIILLNYLLYVHTATRNFHKTVFKKIQQNTLQYTAHVYTVHVHCMYMCICLGRVFLEKNFRGDKTKFSRNDGGQAKIHKIYVVHTLSTCTSFSMLESDRACP